MDRHGGKRSTDGGDSAPSWDDYIDALRQEGRRFRPASLHNRPQVSEREAGKPQAAQYDLFTSPQGRAATRICDRGSRRDEGSAGGSDQDTAARLNAVRGEQDSASGMSEARLRAKRYLAWRAGRG